MQQQTSSGKHIQVKVQVGKGNSAKNPQPKVKVKYLQKYVIGSTCDLTVERDTTWKYEQHILKN